MKVNADYMLFAMVLHEEELSIDVVSGRAVLRAQFIKKQI